MTNFLNNVKNKDIVEVPERNSSLWGSGKFCSKKYETKESGLNTF